MTEQTRAVGSPRPAAVGAAVLLAQHELHRQEELAISEQAYSAFFIAWAAFLRGRTTGQLAPWFDLLADLAEPLAEAAYDLALDNYLTVREMSGVTDERPRFDRVRLDVEALWRSMRYSVIDPLAKKKPLTPRDIDVARTRGAGEMQLAVQAPGRELVHRAIRDAVEVRQESPRRVIPPTQVDRQLIGYMRVTDGDPCFFCAMLAARGAVFATPRAALYGRDGEKYHPRCNCRPVPVYTDNPALPDMNVEMAELWREAQEKPPPGERLGQQKPREGSGNLPDVAGRRARNNFRRALAARRRERDARGD